MFAGLSGASRQQQEHERSVATKVLESMEGQLIAVYAEKELLHNEIGVSEATEIIALVNALVERVRQHEPDFDYQGGGDAGGTDAVGETAESDLPEGVDGFKDLSHRVRILTGTINSMEAQLIDVYADRELLYREGGIKQTQDVLTRLRENEKLRAQVSVMEDQVAALYAQRHALTQGLGRSDAGEIVAIVRAITDALETAQHAAARLVPAPRESAGTPPDDVHATVADEVN